ncbi:response regulator [Aestuariispira insulae]|uniref:Response regulator receiver domain-containing protein n=1 Tax=Aestuariispira insulae TaxID=1461337 RepID=A0A3D9HGK9_9PROT|nr:response regulator [Aestuariispira insulae]RED48594.1 response regulator receiver domain-containing protein [Aestuariispira insulae]
MSPERMNILVVDDDEIDTESVRRLFRKRQMPVNLHVAKDGVEALAVIRGEGGYPCLKHPCMLLVDINMPRMNGLELLEAIREDPALRDLPVFILTTSDAAQDIQAANECAVEGYFLKGQDEDYLMQAIQSAMGVGAT